MVMSACSVCGEFPKPLPNWKPKQTRLKGGGWRIEGTPFYCACNRPPDLTQPITQEEED